MQSADQDLVDRDLDSGLLIRRPYHHDVVGTLARCSRTGRIARLESRGGMDVCCNSRKAIEHANARIRDLATHCHRSRPVRRSGGWWRDLGLDDESPSARRVGGRIGFGCRDRAFFRPPAKTGITEKWTTGTRALVNRCRDGTRYRHHARARTHPDLHQRLPSPRDRDVGLRAARRPCGCNPPGIDAHDRRHRRACRSHQSSAWLAVDLAIEKRFIADLRERHHVVVKPTIQPCHCARSRAIHPCGDVIPQRGPCDFAQDDAECHRARGARPPPQIDEPESSMLDPASKGRRPGRAMLAPCRRCRRRPRPAHRRRPVPCSGPRSNSPSPSTSRGGLARVRPARYGRTILSPATTGASG